ncbi:phage tail protein [Aequorivita echinoideorum]|uniref:Phage tail protein n=1 Tax=Aequorivita echinoideorum TaxID=1549647 RepID=A0ABS5S5Z3_9FLAO|nr:phage tail protein [Aequorivita echinoideorum]MBT0608623.1 phage tail protein [Aequorivita echinoideorum]
MKKTILLSFISFILCSCTSENFYETQRYFNTDKESYNVGDEFELTIFIAPQKDEKEIRLYDNYKNLQISFSLINSEKGIHNGSWTKRSNEFLNDTSTTKFRITKKKPFKKSFTGIISETETEIIIEIPELNFSDGLPKSEFGANNKVRIHGLCDPIDPEIGASIEEFIEVKDIEIITI